MIMTRRYKSEEDERNEWISGAYTKTGYIYSQILYESINQRDPPLYRTQPVLVFSFQCIRLSILFFFRYSYNLVFQLLRRSSVYFCHLDSYSSDQNLQTWISFIP